MTYDEVKESIKKHEGYRLEPYKCTEGHFNRGIGHKIIDGEEIPDKKQDGTWSYLIRILKRF